jgi:molybdopterin converting factor small subunit
MVSVRIEFLGLARERAGVAQLELSAETLGEVLRMLAARVPAMRVLLEGERLGPAMVANLNGERFVSDARTPLRDSDSLLLLSADAGG